MKTDARKERLSLITPFKEAQEALKQEKIRVQGLRDRLSELNEQASGRMKTADEIGKRRQSILSDAALGNSPQATLSTVRKEHDEAIRSLEDTKEMITTVQAALEGDQTIAKYKEASNIENRIWFQIESELKSDPPKEVKAWIERVAASHHKATRFHTSLSHPFDPCDWTEVERERILALEEAMKQEFFL